MPSSQAIVVLGMHRSGTSVLTRGLRALGVFLGDDFLPAEFDNPTGYWENKGTLALNERLLATLGLNWESLSLIDDSAWRLPSVQTLVEEAATYLRGYFLAHSVWGFKDPRTIRVLPFWRAVFERLDVDDRYVVAIRNPLGVAASLAKRQVIPPATSHLLSLVYLVPYLHEITSKPFVVTDYDLLIDDAPGQLARIKRLLQIPDAGIDAAEIQNFSTQFLNPNLRHSYFSWHDFDAIPEISSLVRQAYLGLYSFAIDRQPSDTEGFWSNWKRIREEVTELVAEVTSTNRHGIDLHIPKSSEDADAVATETSKESKAEATISPTVNSAPSPSSHFKFMEHPIFPGTNVKLFIVTGAQRTGTNLLREILNTNDQVAMLGEILSPSSAPAHWENFLRAHPDAASPVSSPSDMEALLDRYFQFVLYRIRNHWISGDKSRCRAMGVDIKYNQLRQLAPIHWDPAEPPFLLAYLRARGATLIHTTRRNVIHCVISAMIATQRNFWHNYEGVAINRRYHIDVDQCLKFAQRIVADRDVFVESIRGCKVVDCCYEDLTAEIGKADPVGEILVASGVLRNIADALGVPFRFRYDGRLRKAIDIPYSQLLLNQQALALALRQSEFSAFASTLD
jgi:LPS sulfotransferase NodH